MPMILFSFVEALYPNFWRKKGTNPTQISK